MILFTSVSFVVSEASFSHDRAVHGKTYNTIIDCKICRILILDNSYSLRIVNRRQTMANRDLRQYGVKTQKN